MNIIQALPIGNMTSQIIPFKLIIMLGLAQILMSTGWGQSTKSNLSYCLLMLDIYFYIISFNVQTIIMYLVLHAASFYHL